MRKFLAVLMTLILLFSLVACASDKKPQYVQDAGGGTVSGESSTPSDAQSTPSTNTTSPSTSDSSSTPDFSLDDIFISTPNTSSTPNNSIIDTDSLTVHEDIKNYSIFYNISEYSAAQTDFNTEYWKMPYGREDDGAFVREGYVLLGYSYNSNGKGELIRPGYKYILPSTGTVQNLYCVWAKETNPADFKTAQKSSSAVYITSYKGSDSVVYIPREIDGKTVTGIAADAFKNNKALTEVHITSSVNVVEENAFASCSNLKTVTLYDNIRTISDASFKGCNIKTVRLCAGKTPRYVTSYGYGIKYERLIKTKGQKRIIVVAGSSALYGIETEYMESLFEDNYEVVNFGINANMNLLVYLDAIAPLLSKNDIVIFSPEQYGPYAYHTNGNTEIPSVTFQGFSSCYNLVENVDMSTYTEVFDNLGQYCAQSARMPQLTWQDRDKELDKFGDRANLTSILNSPNYRYGANGYFRFNETVIPKEFIKNLNRKIDGIKKTNAKILFSYPPHNKNNIEADSLNENAYNTYNKWTADTVSCQMISDIRNYIYNGEYFSNTDYHLNAVGRKMHTKQLANDIKNAGIGVK
ncbi:MAG: leucine-rich repeat domain-containing protein [Clostridia bacterium]|nr:leucine-rich repeat domain-containing protein [Clostridia bacterium]